MLGRANILRSRELALDDRLDEVGSAVAVEAVMVILVVLLHQADVGSCCCCCPRCYPAGVDIDAGVAMNNVCDVGVVVVAAAGIKVPACEIVIGMVWCLGVFVMWCLVQVRVVM